MVQSILLWRILETNDRVLIKVVEAEEGNRKPLCMTPGNTVLYSKYARNKSTTLNINLLKFGIGNKITGFKKKDSISELNLWANINKRIKFVINKTLNFTF